MRRSTRTKHCPQQFGNQSSDLALDTTVRNLVKSRRRVPPFTSSHQVITGLRQDPLLANGTWRFTQFAEATN